MYTTLGQLLEIQGSSPKMSPELLSEVSGETTCLQRMTVLPGFMEGSLPPIVASTVVLPLQMPAGISSGKL
jgi:hypothetical protein